MLQNDNSGLKVHILSLRNSSSSAPMTTPRNFNFNKISLSLRKK